MNETTFCPESLWAYIRVHFVSVKDWVALYSKGAYIWDLTVSITAVFNPNSAFRVNIVKRRTFTSISVIF